MNVHFKTFKNIKNYEINDEQIMCCYFVLSNRIRASSGFFNKLNENEAHFSLAHEEHHKKNRVLYLFFIIFFISINRIFCGRFQ